MHDALLSIEGLTVCYGDFPAVSSASLSVAAEGVSALIGANGAGKTTLLEAAAGLHRPKAGKIFFQGEDITGLPPEEIVRRGLCLVPQGGRCFPRMSVEDNLLMGSYSPRGRKNARQSLERVYALFPALMQKRKAPAGSLSGGQRQMTAIGRAFMADPKCILFDEISLGLAPVVIHDLYERIQTVNAEEKTAILLVEQDTEKALVLSDTCFVMLKGSVTLSGPSGKLRPEDIRSAYFGI
ncbi:MAG: ABC transporter ATP-binding protein [Clostridia bacterium]|nr:ABC transporter ATP-binding protein [Clostridia bacterium]